MGELMTLLEWADNVLLKDADFKACDIFIVNDTNGHYLEVEIDNGIIASTFFVSGDLAAARQTADELEAHLNTKGILVCDDYYDWQTSFDEYADDNA